MLTVVGVPTAGEPLFVQTALSVLQKAWKPPLVWLQIATHVGSASHLACAVARVPPAPSSSIHPPVRHAAAVRQSLRGAVSQQRSVDAQAGKLSGVSKRQTPWPIEM